MNVGAERFLGEATYGIEPARAAAAREALDRKGQSSSLRSSNDPIKALLRFCRTQGLSEPDYFLYFGSSKALLSESLADSQNTSRADSISILDDVLKTFQSHCRGVYTHLDTAWCCRGSGTPEDLAHPCQTSISLEYLLQGWHELVPYGTGMARVPLEAAIAQGVNEQVHMHSILPNLGSLITWLI